MAASPNCNPGLLPNPAPRFHLNTSICRQCRESDKHCQKNYCPDAGQDVPLWVMGQESGLEQATRDYSWGKQFKVRNYHDICKFNQILLTLSFLIHTPIWHQNLDMKNRGTQCLCRSQKYQKTVGYLSEICQKTVRKMTVTKMCRKTVINVSEFCRKTVRCNYLSEFYQKRFGNASEICHIL